MLYIAVGISDGVCCYQVFDLEDRRRASMEDLAILIQKTYRGWHEKAKVAIFTQNI